MQLYPAIDIKEGKCVRLTQGVFDNIKVYSDSPSQIAKLWVSQGATFLHLGDLDGALAGKAVNGAIIKEIIEAVDVPVQLGGGIRSEEAVKSILDLGVHRVIIGTKAVKEPEFIKVLIERFGPEQIVAGIDAKDGKVAVEGWEKVSTLTAGVCHVVYTDISRDGMLTGPNISATKKLTEEIGMDIIASGGVSCMEDLQKLYEEGIGGTIIGKALYEKRLNLEDAIRRFA